MGGEILAFVRGRFSIPRSTCGFAFGFLEYNPIFAAARQNARSRAAPRRRREFRTEGMWPRPFALEFRWSCKRRGRLPAPGEGR